MKSTFPSSSSTSSSSSSPLPSITTERPRMARLGVVALTLSLAALAAAQAQVPPAPPASSAGSGQGGGNNGTMGNSGEKTTGSALSCKPTAVFSRLDTRQPGALHAPQGMAAKWALMQERVRQQAGACVGQPAGSARSSAAAQGVNKR